MTTTELRIGDIGTVIELHVVDGTTPVNLAGATSLSMTFKKPDGSTLVKTATLSGAGTDGLMRYITEAGFLDQAKTWQVQGHVVLPDWQGHTQIGTFVVANNL